MAARSAGLEGMVVPSRFTPTVQNLVVFPDTLQVGSSIEVVDPEGGFSVRLEKQS